jgi:hypothetical protein
MYEYGDGAADAGAAPRHEQRSIVVDARQRAGEQEYDEDDDHQAQDAAEPTATVRAIAVVSASTEEEDQ